MIIVRASNSQTGEVFEITSTSHPVLKGCRSDLEIIRYAGMVWGHTFESTDTDIDKIEVIAK